MAQVRGVGRQNIRFWLRGLGFLAEGAVALAVTLNRDAFFAS